mmetsp:Transcript_36798/g.56528  ORF Transcript_36798/g.56528 Transcript_36798/m.56528 type:complete len:220 (+) Transcript_36798:294-953(+)
MPLIDADHALVGTSCGNNQSKHITSHGSNHNGCFRESTNFCQYEAIFFQFFFSRELPEPTVHVSVLLVCPSSPIYLRMQSVWCDTARFEFFHCLQCSIQGITCHEGSGNPGSTGLFQRNIDVVRNRHRLRFVFLQFIASSDVKAKKRSRRIKKRHVFLDASLDRWNKSHHRLSHGRSQLYFIRTVTRFSVATIILPKHSFRSHRKILCLLVIDWQVGTR